MISFDKNSIKNFDKLTSNQLIFFEILEPFLVKIDITKLHANSKIEIYYEKGDPALNINLVPNIFELSLLNIFFSKNQFILSLAESEYMEIHNNVENQILKDITQITSIINRYLSSFTIVEYYNKKEKLIKKEYYWGNNSSDENNKIGTSYYNLALFRKKLIIKENTFSFF